MNWKMNFMLLATALLFSTGCVPAQVEGTFVSGHLGNYSDCPGDGYSLSDDSARGAPADFASDAACYDEGENSDCGSAILNCEDAQATVRLDNTGTEPVDELMIAKIELLDDAGLVRAELPLINVFHTDDGRTFDGVVTPGQTLDLRIDFQGPSNLSEFVKDGQSAYIRIIFDSDTHPAVIINSDELYRIPSVVT